MGPLSDSLAPRKVVLSSRSLCKHIWSITLDGSFKTKAYHNYYILHSFLDLFGGGGGVGEVCVCFEATTSGAQSLFLVLSSGITPGRLALFKARWTIRAGDRTLAGSIQSKYPPHCTITLIHTSYFYIHIVFF